MWSARNYLKDPKTTGVTGFQVEELLQPALTFEAKKEDEKAER